MMTKSESLKVIENLAHYEIDGSLILDQVLASLENLEVQNELFVYKKKCETNIEELSFLIENLGGQPPSRTSDAKGYIMQGYTVIQGLLSDIHVLKALNYNLQLIMKAYQKAMESSISQDLKDVIRTLFENCKILSHTVNEEIDRLQCVVN